MMSSVPQVFRIREATLYRRIDALRNHCPTCQHLSASAWDLLPHIRFDQAVALSVTEEIVGAPARAERELGYVTLREVRTGLRSAHDQHCDWTAV